MKRQEHHAVLIHLTVNSIWGVPTPLTEKKFVKKNGKCNQDDFSQVLSKPGVLSAISVISSGGLSRDHQWRGGIQEIYDYQGCWSISQRVLNISS